MFFPHKVKRKNALIHQKRKHIVFGSHCYQLFRSFQWAPKLVSFLRKAV